MNQYKKGTDDILGKLQETSQLLDQLQQKYEFVEDKTKGLQHACETLLDEQVKGFS